MTGIAFTSSVYYLVNRTPAELLIGLEFSERPAVRPYF